MISKIVICNANKSLFDDLTRKCEYGGELFKTTYLDYKGSNISGDVTIKIKALEEDDYKQAILSVKETLENYY